MSRERCAACNRPSAGNYSIHRDGMGEGPDVPLCDNCGQFPTPTCDELWAAIRKRRETQPVEHTGVNAAAAAPSE